MPVSDDEACTALYVLWEADGDSIEVACGLTGEHPQHEAEVDGSAAFTDDTLVIRTKAKVCWPLDVRVWAS